MYIEADKLFRKILDNVTRARAIRLHIERHGEDEIENDVLEDLLNSEEQLLEEINGFITRYALLVKREDPQHFEDLKRRLDFIEALPAWGIHEGNDIVFDIIKDQGAIGELTGGDEDA